MMDIKVKNMKLEQDFILLDILCIMYLIFSLHMKEFVKLGLNLNTKILH